jgi:hypothetical protein
MDNEYLVIEEYWKALSLAHECSSKVNEDDTVEYTGLSPDDIELVKTVVPDKVINLYMSCTTKNNIIILFEMVLIKSNHIYAEIKYKSESLVREKDFESYLTILLSDVEVVEQGEELTCR